MSKLAKQWKNETPTVFVAEKGAEQGFENPLVAGPQALPMATPRLPEFMDSGSLNHEQFIEWRLFQKRSTANAKPSTPAIARACVDCEEVIRYARLRANPMTERCIDCQVDFEVEEKRTEAAKALYEMNLLKRSYQ